MNGNHRMNKLITGSVESVDQLLAFIEGLNDTEYQFVATPWFTSSIGQHLRHIVDLYLALMSEGMMGNAPQQECIDYDVRRRGAPVESRRDVGVAEMKAIRHWLTQITANDLASEVWVNTEVALTEQQSVAVKSSFARELCFASSHLTHHLAIMAAIAKMAGKTVDSALGLAPATATFTRLQEARSANSTNSTNSTKSTRETASCAQ